MSGMNCKLERLVRRWIAKAASLQHKAKQYDEIASNILDSRNTSWGVGGKLNGGIESMTAEFARGMAHGMRMAACELKANSVLDGSRLSNQLCDVCKEALVMRCPACSDRTASQNATNMRWLLECIDRIHAALCPSESGTWQQRAEQAIAVAESLSNAPNQSGEGRP